MDQNSPNLWGTFLTALKTVRYVKGDADVAEAVKELALLTLDEQLEQEAVADIENRPPTTCNFVLATQPESSSKEDEATPGYFTQDSEDENERHQSTSRGLTKRARRLNGFFLMKIHTQKIANMSEWCHQAPVSLLDASLQQVFPSAVSL